MSNTREDEGRYRCPDSVLHAAQALQRALLDAIEYDGCSVYVVDVTPQGIRIQGRGRLSGGAVTGDGRYRYEQVEAGGVVETGVTECSESSAAAAVYADDWGPS